MTNVKRSHDDVKPFTPNYLNPVKQPCPSHMPPASIAVYHDDPIVVSIDSTDKFHRYVCPVCGFIIYTKKNLAKTAKRRINN